MGPMVGSGRAEESWGPSWMKLRISILVLLIAPVAAVAQSPDDPPNVYLDVSIDARNRLRQIQSYLRQQQWPEATLALEKLIEAYPDKVVPVSPEASDCFVSLRRYCHYQLATLPEEALTLYRKRVDPQANELWKKFEQTGDERHLERLAGEYFASSFTDRALDRLGDRALTLGYFSEAIGWWGPLLPPAWTDLGVGSIPPPADGDLKPAAAAPREIRLVFPHPRTDSARVAAKLTLAVLLEGDQARARALYQKLTREFPQARGTLAGKTSAYHEILRDLLAERDAMARPPEDENWPTYAGNARRSKVFPKPFDVGEVEWSWPIKEEGPPNNPALRDPDDAANRDDNLPFHPIVVGQTVLLATDRSLRSFHLGTGKEDRWEDFRPEGGNRFNDGFQRGNTLTAVGNRVLVRTGGNIEQRRFNQFGQQPFIQSSKLACYDWTQQRQLWETSSNTLAEDGNVVFEGAPVAQGNQVFIAATRVDAMAQASVCCLDLESGKVRWRTLVCESTLENDDGNAGARNLLTLADRTLYYCTNLGAVAALNSETGKIRWVATYARGRRPGPRSQMGISPEINPCVYEHGRLFVAASDAPRIQCLDAQTGRKLWEAQPAVTHVLGVAKGNLIVSGNRVWGIDVVSGKIRWYWPENPVRGYGRGILAGDYVYWPTKTEIHILDQETGRKGAASVELYNRLRLKAGNLVLGGDHLLIAQSNRLLALVPHSRLLHRLERELVANPRSALPHYRFAVAAMAAEAYAPAIEHFDLAAQLADPRELYSGHNLRQHAKGLAQEATRLAAKAAAARGRFDEGLALLSKADAASGEVDQRLAARKMIVDIALTAGQPRRAMDALMSIADPELAEGWVEVEEGRHLSARHWAIAKSQELIAANGRGIYAAGDAAVASAMLPGANPELLRSVVERFPNAAGRDAALLAAARGFERLGRAREAWLVAREIIDPWVDAGPIAHASRREALLLVDRMFKERQWNLAREPIWRALETQFGTEPFPAQAGRTIGEYVQSERRHALAANAAGASLELSKWRLPVGGARWLEPTGAPPSDRFLGLARVAGTGVRYIASDRGAALWDVAVRESPQWAAYGKFGLLLGGAGQLSCLGYDSGQVLWEQPRRPASADRNADRRFPVSGDFYESDGRVVLVASDRSLRAFDAEDGFPCWSVRLANEMIGGPRIFGTLALAQLADRLEAYRLRDGKRAWSLPTMGQLEPSPVLAIDEGILAMVDPGTLACVTHSTGKIQWRAKLGWPSHQPPRLYRSGTALLALVDGYQLLRLDAATGDVRWEAALEKQPLADPDARALMTDTAFIWTADGWVTARRLTDGAVAWRTPLAEVESTAKLGWYRDRIAVLTGTSRPTLVLLAAATGRPVQAMSAIAGVESFRVGPTGIWMVGEKEVEWVGEGEPEPLVRSQP